MEVYKFVRKAPFSRVFAALVTGALLSNISHFPILIIIGIIGLAYFFIFHIKNSFYRGILVTLAWIGVGLADTQVHKLQPFSQFGEGKENMLVLIDEQVRLKNDKYLLITKLLALNDSNTENKNWRLLITVPKDSLCEEFYYGERLYLQAQIQPIKNYGNPYEFDYQKYLLQKKIVAKAWVSDDHILRLDGFRGSRLMQLSLKVRNYLLSKYSDSGIKGQNLAILSALSLGYKSGLERETKNIFAHTGAMHVLAVSGLHVGIIFSILLGLLRYIPAKLRLKIQFPLLLAGVWIFALISGLSASVTRASLMFSFVALAESLRRNTSIYNSVFLAAIFQFLANPMVIYEVGFQLSYVAVLSIIWLQPKIAGIFSIKKKLLKLIWDLTAVSIAAMLGTTPIGLYYFHQFPNYFILSNLIVVPLVGSVIMPLAIVFLTFSWFPIVAKIVAFVLNLSISFLFMSVRIIDGLPFSVIQNISFSLWEIFFSAAILLIFILFFIKKHFKYLKTGLILISVYLSILFFIKLNGANQKAFIIYNSPKTTTLQVISKGYAMNYSNTDSSHIGYIRQLFQKTEMQMHTFHEKELILTQKTFFRFDKYLVGVLNNKKWKGLSTKVKLDIDILVLGDKNKISIAELSKLFKFKQIVLDASVKQYQRKKWIAEAQKEKINLYDVKNQGAFVLME